MQKPFVPVGTCLLLMVQLVVGGTDIFYQIVGVYE